MKKSLLILAFAAIAFGCTSTKTSTNTTDIQIQEPNVSFEAADGQLVGETCNQDLLCGDSLECVEGACKEIFVDESITCEKILDPVCGINPNGITSGYLNPCQAERYGAEITHKGFCPDTTKSEQTNE